MSSSEITNAVLAALEQFKPQLVKSSQEAAKKAVQDVIQNQQSTIANLRNRMERKRKLENVNFNKRGNEEQYNHTTEVLETVEEAIESIQLKSFDEAKDYLEKGKKLLETRMKHIRIADRNGWLTVKEFKSDELASGDEDEKRLKRAIKSADSLREKYTKRTKSDHKEDSHTATRKNPTRPPLDEVLCYNCKRVGHYASSCPFVQKTQPFTPTTSTTTNKYAEKNNYRT